MVSLSPFKPPKLLDQLSATPLISLVAPMSQANRLERMKFGLVCAQQVEHLAARRWRRALDNVIKSEPHGFPKEVVLQQLRLALAVHPVLLFFERTFDVLGASTLASRAIEQAIRGDAPHAADLACQARSAFLISATVFTAELHATERMWQLEELRSIANR